MLIEDAHNDQLKAWLTAELGPICDADPEVLADYVLALLKHEAPEAELRKLLIEQLEDFLAAETEPFVGKTFDALANKSYLPQDTTAHGWDESSATGAADVAEGSRKRRADDDDTEEYTPHQARRLDNDSKFRSRGPDMDSNRREPRKQMCRDFHKMGYCPRGASCKFEHSSSVAGGPGGMQQLGRGQFLMNNMMGPGGMGQMPPPSGMMFPGQPYGMPPQGWHPGMQPSNGEAPALRSAGPPHVSEGQQPGFAHFGQPTGHAGGRGRGRGRGAGPPGTFQSSRRSNTTLVIENVPAEHLDLIKVNEYFKKFGTITNISIDKPGSKALVSYSQPSEAKTAHESPDVIFDNRFVKVYFQRLDEGGPSTVAQTAAPTPPKSNFVPGKTPHVYHARPPTAAPPASFSEEKKKLLEDQKTKQTQLDAQLAEQKALMGKFSDKTLSAEDKRETMSRLKKLGDEIKASTQAVKAAVEAIQTAPKDVASSGSTGLLQQEREKREREQLDRELDMHSRAAAPESSATDELKKKLESLKAEAASLGLDSSGAPVDGFSSRGRGRGGYVPRGRGAFAPYGRGRGAAQANRSLRLDNRTTRVRVSELPSDVDQDKLQTYFGTFGEIDTVEGTGEQELTIVYKSRNSGEQALRAGTEIPNIGSVKMSWVQPPVSATPTAPAMDDMDTAAVTNGSGEDEYDDDRESSRRR